MRLFAAVVPPDRVVDDLQVAVTEVVAGEQDRTVRWNPRQRWHLTLAFYGEGDAHERVTMLRDRLPRHVDLRLCLAGAGTFPGVLWAGVDGDIDGLAALADVAGASERRPYHAHVTLARWRTRRPPALAQRVSTALAGYRGPVWQPAEVALMRSVLGRGGPEYTVLTTFPLAP